MNPESSIFTLAEQEGKDIMTSQSQPIVASNGQPEAAITAAFTAGPWEAHLSRWTPEAPVSGWWVSASSKSPIHDKEPPSVASVGVSERYAVSAFYTPSELEANARLIAAAPDLLAACQDMLVAREAEAKAQLHYDRMCEDPAAVSEAEFEAAGEALIDRTFDSSAAEGRAREAVAKALGATPASPSVASDKVPGKPKS